MIWALVDQSITYEMHSIHSHAHKSICTYSHSHVHTKSCTHAQYDMQYMLQTVHTGRQNGLESVVAWPLVSKGEEKMFSNL